MRDTLDEQYLSLGEAAKKLDVHPSTVRRWANSGALSSIRTPGGHRRFALKDIYRMASGTTVQSMYNLEITSRLQENSLAHARADLRGEQPSWSSNLDTESREEKRILGQRLMGLLMQYIGSEDDDGEEVLDEARIVGRIYAKNIIQNGISLSEAIQATAFFRDHILESAVMVPDSARSRPQANKRLFRRINEFLNAIQLVIAEAYERSDQLPG
ncbi:MAG: helix-turn-helix domain-containing protein [Rhodothermia bacterium]|nr:MAG: helix-turn-helix domain-containing protein [Rhodothermia bacterium]